MTYCCKMKLVIIINTNYLNENEYHTYGEGHSGASNSGLFWGTNVNGR